jgi:hypothetical protein
MEKDQLKEELHQEETSLKDSLEDLGSNLRGYFDTYYKLSVVKLAQKATNAGAGALVAITLCTFGLFVVLFASIAAALWIGNAIGSTAGGFMIVAGFYLLVVLCIIMLRKKIVFPFIRNSIIRKMYE